MNNAVKKLSAGDIITMYNNHLSVKYKMLDYKKMHLIAEEFKKKNGLKNSENIDSYCTHKGKIYTARQLNSYVDNHNMDLTL